MAGLTSRTYLLQALMRTVAVVVPGILGQDAAEVPLAEDLEPDHAQRGDVEAVVEGEQGRFGGQAASTASGARRMRNSAVRTWWSMSSVASPAGSGSVSF
jgi:hypothetical protein